MQVLLEHDTIPGKHYKNVLIIGDKPKYTLNECVLTEGREKSGLLKFRGKLQEADAVNKNMRMYPYNVLNENVIRMKEALDNGGIIGELDHCLVTTDFDVLTPNGWMPFKNIRVGDEVYSRVEGKMVKSKVLNIIDQPYEGKTIKIKGKFIDCEFTPNHRVLACVRNDHRSNPDGEYYETIENIHLNRTKHSHNYIPKTAKWEAENSDKTIKLNTVMKDNNIYVVESLDIDAGKFAAFLGLYLSEGYTKNNTVYVCQSTEYGKKVVKKILDDMHLELKWKEYKNGYYLTNMQLASYLKPLGNKYNKYIPEEIKKLSPEYLEKLIVAFAIGDGRMLQSDDCGKTCTNIKRNDEVNLKLDQGIFTRISVFSVSEKLIDDLEECLVKCGYSGTRSIVNQKNSKIGERIIKAENTKLLHNLHFSRSKNIHLDPRFLKTIEGYHSGRVYCLTTEYGNFYMRHKGKSFWTGNSSDSVLHFQSASHKFTKLWWEGKVLMGEGYILNTPYGKIMQTLINDGVEVGMSSRGVGNAKTDSNGILVIEEGYRLITFDCVADPSTYGAVQRKVENFENNYIKNEKNNFESINKNKVDLLLDILESGINKKVKEYTKRV